MEFLKLFEMGTLTHDDMHFMLWVYGAIGGYIVGRLHAAFILLRKHSARS